MKIFVKLFFKIIYIFYEIVYFKKYLEEDMIVIRIIYYWKMFLFL